DPRRQPPRVHHRLRPGRRPHPHPRRTSHPRPVLTQIPLISWAAACPCKGQQRPTIMLAAAVPPPSPAVPLPGLPAVLPPGLPVIPPPGLPVIPPPGLPAGVMVSCLAELT